MSRIKKSQETNITIGVRNNYCCQADRFDIYEIPSSFITEDILQILTLYTNTVDDINDEMFDSTSKFTIFWNIMQRYAIFQLDNTFDMYKECDYLLYYQIC